MNACYDLNKCIRFARAVEPFKITWLEEPLHWYLQPDDFRKLAESTNTAAHGERLYTGLPPETISKTVESNYANRLTRHSGFTEHLRIAHMAEQKAFSLRPTLRLKCMGT